MSDSSNSGSESPTPDQGKRGASNEGMPEQLFYDSYAGTEYDPIPEPHPRGTIIFVLGLLSLIICPPVLGTIALVMGNKALREIKANPRAYSNRPTVMVGRLLGIFGLILTLIWAVLLGINIASKGSGS